MRKILWIILLALSVLAVAMIIHEGLRDAIVYGLQDTVVAPAATGFGNLAAAIVASDFWIAYVAPYMFWWGMAAGFVIVVVSVKIFWPRVRKYQAKAAPVKRALQDKLTPSPPVAIQSSTAAPQQLRTNSPATVDRPPPEVDTSSAEAETEAAEV